MPVFYGKTWRKASDISTCWLGFDLKCKKVLQSYIKKANTRHFATHCKHVLQITGKSMASCEHASQPVDLECWARKTNRWPVVFIPPWDWLILVKDVSCNNWHIRRRSIRFKNVKRITLLFRHLFQLHGKKWQFLTNANVPSVRWTPIHDFA